MRFIKRNIEVRTNPIRATYTTDCFRKVRDEETGEVSVKRWVEERQVTPTVALVLDIPAVFYRGARIA
jgi:hypothetical protein